MKIRTDKSHIDVNSPHSRKFAGTKKTEKGIVEPKDTVTRSSGKTNKITILHTNDLHGHTEAFLDERKSDETKVGGLTYLGSRIKKEKSKAPKSTLLLDAGDISTGGAVSDHFKALPMVDAMNKLGYDAMTVGNHDLDMGIDGLQNLTNQANFPILSANLEDNSGKLDDIGSYIIKDVKGTKVGILGLTTPDATDATMMSADEKKQIKFLAVADTARIQMKRMRKEGADVIVVLSHLGVDGDIKLAEKVKGIDVIIGGHSHTEMKEPVKINGAYITQAGTAGENLGKMQIEVTHSGKKAKVTDVYSELIPINKKTARSDKNIRNVLYKYTRKLKTKMERVLGKVGAPLRQRDFHLYKEESTLGNYITDAVRKESGVDVCILSPSGFRRSIQPGKINVGDIHEVYPFNDRLSVTELSGKEIHKALEEILISPFHCFAASGLKVKIDTSKPEGQQVIEVRTQDGKKLSPNKKYKVGGQSSLFRINVSRTLNKSKGHDNKGPVRDLLIQHIEKHPLVIGKKDGRLVNLSKTMN